MSFWTGREPIRRKAARWAFDHMDELAASPHGHWKPFMIVHTISGVRFSPLPKPSVATGRIAQKGRHSNSQERRFGKREN